MPKIEYVPKNFSADRLQMIEKVNGVVAEYQKQGYSLTLRQVYYQWWPAILSPTICGVIRTSET